jgi:phosphatidylserine decarboxylase
MPLAPDLLIAAMRVLPKNGLSRALGKLARARLPRPVLRRLIEAYTRFFAVDLSEAERSLEEYETIDAFFTRALRPGARPFPEDPDLVLAPADSRLHSAGPIVDARLIQAKGKLYSLSRFLEDPDLAEVLTGGTQVTLYLHPRDYHRVHAPLAGRVTGYRYVPGHLFPVNAAAVERVDDLFAINERLITVLETQVGPVAVGMVGAYGVGEISVVYDSIRSNAGCREIVRHDYQDPPVLQAGDELGTFHLGSTVILLFPPGRVLLHSLGPGERLRMGQPIGRCTTGGARFQVLRGA